MDNKSTIDKINEYISLIKQSDIVTKSIESCLIVTTFEGWNIREAIGNKAFNEFIILLREYGDFSELGIKRLKAYSWMLVIKETTKEYGYTIESLIEIENEIKKEEKQKEYEVKANKFEITGWPMDNTMLKRMFFTVYNNLKEEDPSFSRKICKIKNNWWLVDSKTKVEPDEESKKIIDMRKQKLLDSKKGILWVGDRRYKLEEGVTMEEAKSAVNIAYMYWGDGEGYVSDGISYKCDSEIYRKDSEYGTSKIFARLIS